MSDLSLTILLETPDDAPAMMEIVPVGAIVVTVEFRSGAPSL